MDSSDDSDAKTMGGPSQRRLSHGVDEQTNVKKEERALESESGSLTLRMKLGEREPSSVSDLGRCLTLGGSINYAWRESEKRDSNGRRD